MGERKPLTVAQWSPLVDITEDEKEYLIKAELPEMKKEDVRLTVEDDVLAISGERKFEKEEKGKNITGSNAPTGALCAVSHFQRTWMGARCLLTTKMACSTCISRNPRNRNRKPSRSR